MPDETQDSKAQKLAAARRKLKEYQQRNNNNNGQSGAAAAEEAVSQSHSHSSTVSIASNLSERSDSEPNVNGSGGSGIVGFQQPDPPAVLPTAASFFTQSEPEAPHNGGLIAAADPSNLQAIQVIIAEKAQLNAELTKVRLACRERDLELEELRTLKEQTQQRLEQVQQHCQDQQSAGEQQRQQYGQLERQLQKSQAQIRDQQSHLHELEAQLKQSNLRQDELQQQLSTKSNELEMAQLKLRQLSDESSISADNRVESLVQTQYMYEQQIRDLQAMVGQLTQDKEQAGAQYQNYVQHQSSEIAKLNERNTELAEELNSLRERERQLVEHVSGLERDIQKNLSLQAQFKEAVSQEQPLPKEEQTSDEQIALQAELASLKERLSDLDFERHEFQLKIKSQDDQLQLKESALGELEQQLERLQAVQPDQTKLLATMESDKVAASRALSQNVEMKQQLDELQQRFVQLTNDKAELVIRLDAEEFANREIRQNYASMEQKLQATEERFTFKDEEMIRLSHENVELQRQQLMLQQQLDRLQHYEAKAYHNSQESQAGETLENDAEKEHNHDHNDHGDHSGHSHDHSHDHAGHSHDHSNEHSHEHSHSHSQEPNHGHNHSHDTNHRPSTAGGSLPTAEAVERLQSRFTTLISQVADLTEEKHSLEHLVLQLQSETETIGEYIALYQTQRRMLKQREYEKAAQMRLLQAEREQLREKIEALNKLVSSLGVEPPTPTGPGQTLQPHEAAAAAADSPVADEGENSQQIINKIQDIISEIKENTEQPTHSHSHAGDHLNCCLGKFEVV
ncbi:golgin subfamily A member 2 isoform X1 [Drosophila kikkawai]|uniref:Golgin subfamily A member 2 isoform X1 n=1 Tax=Drosophila kikkawai TaxID=30033 RepID=A0A6P4JRB3_DROKI|nr:golgin subfamily A member 2 isoform X1 [Drosophila kikkawai]